MLDSATSTSELMGLEGAAAAAYWPVVGALLPEGMQFANRSKQPPRDVPNAALSFLYTILAGEAVTALHSTGLEPCIGLLHSEADDRPALALDLMEEFRPLVVDQVVLQALRRGSITEADARQEPPKPGVLLNKKGREALVSAYENRMLRKTSGAIPGFTGSVRRHLYRQAQRLANAIMDPGADWTGMSYR